MNQEGNRLVFEQMKSFVYFAEKILGQQSFQRFSEILVVIVSAK